MDELPYSINEINLSPYRAHMDIRKRFEENIGVVPAIRESGITILRQIYWKIRKYEKARGYLLRDRLRYIWRKRSSTKKNLSIRYVKKLADVKGKEFVFFPLHTEPEVALQGLSPEYFYQLSSIAALSRDLPAGAFLVVKETYEAVGRRPDNFYDQIIQFKNVIMLDMLEYGPEVIKESRAVATITGTAGFEAAVMGKPVITFGQHNIYNFLKHVMVVEQEKYLKNYLEYALSTSFDSDIARRDGERFLRTLIDCSFDIGKYNITDPENIEQTNIQNVYEALKNSLNQNNF